MFTFSDVISREFYYRATIIETGEQIFVTDSLKHLYRTARSHARAEVGEVKFGREYDAYTVRMDYGVDITRRVLGEKYLHCDFHVIQSYGTLYVSNWSECTVSDNMVSCSFTRYKVAGTDD